MTTEDVLELAQEDRFAAFIAAGEPDSELIGGLLRSPDLRAMSVQRADAFAIEYPFLRAVRFPEGAYDIAANIPGQDLQLLAARVQLLVSAPFPPALADLLLQAASETHANATPFSSRGGLLSSSRGHASLAFKASRPLGISKRSRVLQYSRPPIRPMA